MIFQIELNEQKAQPVVSIRTKTNLENLPKLIGESYMKIMGYITERGEQPVDAPFTAYYNIDMQNLDVEMGFPVAKRLPDKGEIKAGEIPQGKVVSCVYKGAYSGVEQPYSEMFKWIAGNGYEHTGVYYEYYYNSPADVPENELLTRLVLPLKLPLFMV